MNCSSSDSACLRRAQRSDLPEILDLERQSFSQPWTRALFQEELAKLPPTLYVYRSTPAGPLGGYLCFWTVAGELQLINIAVHPEQRGTGLGRRLMEFLLQEARRRQAEKIFLEVRPSNLPALRLYTRMGFQVLYRRPRYYEPEGEDALVMALTVATE
ncbi:MAG: ribosomal protein S18-alanine N-acetyltransferase [Deltaproteobacteria bacterium]|nr:ribosomal protein S18-alanine N-acetyltransferase [Deltaproteobacteria bacterium]